MGNSWSKWYTFDVRGNISENKNDIYGIYKIRAVNSKGLIIKVPRIGGIDKAGILYIGRSGFKSSNRYRSISKRLKEFYLGNHSGGWTSELSYKYCLSSQKIFLNYQYEASILQVPDNAISIKEATELEIYFNKFGELPPYNSSFPNKLKFKLQYGK